MNLLIPVSCFSVKYLDKMSRYFHATMFYKKKMSTWAKQYSFAWLWEKNIGRTGFMPFFLHFEINTGILILFTESAFCANEYVSRPDRGLSKFQPFVMHDDPWTSFHVFRLEQINSSIPSSTSYYQPKLGRIDTGAGPNWRYFVNNNWISAYVELQKRHGSRISLYPRGLRTMCDQYQDFPALKRTLSCTTWDFACAWVHTKFRLIYP